MVGLSAHNEADSVATVAEAASEGLMRSFPGSEAVIVLADNASTDGTAGVFERAAVTCERKVTTTTRARTGKGHAVRTLLREAKARDASVLVLLDADLTSIRPGWIAALANPVLEGYALTTPCYRRDARDAAVTRHLGYPVFLYFAGTDIRQPIGGECALSQTLVRRALSHRWPPGAYGYGIDILLALEAVRRSLPIAGARLGAKVHKPSAPKLVRIFREVASTVLALAAGNAFPGEETDTIAEMPVFGPDITDHVPRVDVHVASFVFVAGSAWRDCAGRSVSILGEDLSGRVNEVFTRGDGMVEEGLWHKCLAEALARVRGGESPENAAETLLAPFLGRTARFWEEVHELSLAEVEAAVSESARKFREVVASRMRAGPGLRPPAEGPFAEGSGRGSRTRHAGGDAERPGQQSGGSDV
jgi:hypothetical protein